jgi:short-subunit dehydrogenase
MFAYRGSTAMITGASKGLGAAFAKELAGRGMNLVLVARSIDALQDLADSLGAQYGVRCVVLQADLAASDAVKRIVTELERLDLKIDLLINNAGLGLTGDFLSHDLAEELASIQVMCRRWWGRMPWAPRWSREAQAASSIWHPIPSSSHFPIWRRTRQRRRSFSTSAKR